jgi:excisionase family DNA binding protein
MSEQYRWITVKEAANLAKISTDLIYAACASGALRSIRLGAGRHIRTTEQWVHSYLASLAKGGPEANGHGLRQSA